MQLAGLTHSVYSTDRFAPQLFATDERPLLRALVGEPAERLSWLFGAVERRTLFAAVRAVADDASAPVRVPFRSGEGTAVLSPRDQGELLVLHVANAAEQSAQPDGAPAPWLADAAQLASWTRARIARVLPVFGGASAVVPAADELRLLRAYGEGLRGRRARAEALRDELAAAARAVPWVAEPAIALGLLHLLLHDVAEAARCGDAAAALCSAWGVAWDKRLPVEGWAKLASFLRAAAAWDAQTAELVATRLDRLLADAEGDPKHVASRLGELLAPATLPPRFAAYIAEFRSNLRRPTMRLYPGLTAKPWHDPADFPLARDLTRMAGEIAREVLALEPGRFQPEIETIARDGAWNVFMLFERGRRLKDHCRLLPVTTALIESHRTVRTLAGLAYVSRLAPGASVRAHRGPTNMRLRCHLGIDVPDGCGIAVNGESGTWRAGECIVFDDSFLHEVWNHGDRDRVVLIVDLWHPDLSDDEVALLVGMHRYAARYATNLGDYWAKNDAARRALYD